MLGGGRGRNPIRHTTCNSGNLLYNTYREQLDDGIITFKKYHEFNMDLYKFQPKKNIWKN